MVVFFFVNRYMLLFRYTMSELRIYDYEILSWVWVEFLIWLKLAIFDHLWTEIKIKTESDQIWLDENMT